MTIQEAIARVDDEKPNTYKESTKIKWLSDIDGRLYHEIVKTHENPDNIGWEGYNDDTDLSTVLIAPDPYSSLYVNYLAAQIDYANGEFTRYNNDRNAFNEGYQAFADYWNRTYRTSLPTRFVY